MKNQFIKYFSILVPNFPALVPVSGAIVNFWILFLVFKKSISISHFFVLLFLCILSLIYGIIYQSFSLKYGLILCLPILLLLVVDQYQIISLKVLRFIFKVLVFLGLISLFGLNVFDTGIKFLFGSSAGLSGVGGASRGVGLIYPEPSHAAPVLILIFHYIVTKNKIFYSGSNSFIFMPLIIFLFYILRSGSLALYLAVYLVALFVFLDESVQKKIFLLVCIFLINWIGYTLVPEARFFQVFEALINLILSGQLSIEKTALIASGRFIANYVWIVTGLNSFFGLGLVFTVPDFISHSHDLGVDYKVIGAFSRRGVEGLPVLPRSWFAVVVGAFGFIGIFITALVLSLYARMLKKNKLKVGANDKPLLVFALFYLLVVGFPGSPIPWLVILLCGYQPIHRTI